MDDTPKALAMLKEAHVFPGPYTFKAIGENSANFVAQLCQAIVVVTGPKSVPEVTTRQSAKGNHQAVHMTVHVTDAEQVLRLYAAIKTVPGIRFLL
jgi:hypothetical protein